MGGIVLEGNGIGNVVRLAGRLGIENASELKRVLVEAFEGGQGIELDVSAVESADLACVQVLCAAHRSFVNAKRHMALGSSIPDGLRRSLRDMSIEASTCDAPYTSECLWGMGGSHV
jgi:anti-anti-sigma regulatory factor